MGLWESIKNLFNGAAGSMSGGNTVKCPHCGAQNTANGYGTPSMPGVTVTEVLEVNCRKCGRMFISMDKK